MAMSVVDVYRDVLAKTNCRDCGFPTCLAFAAKVVSEKYPLANCPHIAADVLARCEIELAEQYSQGKWLKRDMAEDALQWAKSRAASLAVEDLPARIGGELIRTGRGLIAAFDAVQTGDDICRFHAFDEPADSLQVAGAAAEKGYGGDDAVI